MATTGTGTPPSVRWTSGADSIQRRIWEQLSRVVLTVDESKSEEWTAAAVSPAGEGRCTFEPQQVYVREEFRDRGLIPFSQRHDRDRRVRQRA